MQRSILLMVVTQFILLIMLRSLMYMKLKMVRLLNIIYSAAEL
ncbi:Uncharacterised protein [Budvicia aquatica]|uniref:Uncharacterized protein n=1 Tax=Budvicia aquatica TaxID=82979 RepID=A0A484ZYV0_9GAMM|nr:Uncharacterised protein [Budvicia aquatica]